MTTFRCCDVVKFGNNRAGVGSQVGVLSALDIVRAIGARHWRKTRCSKRDAVCKEAGVHFQKKNVEALSLFICRLDDLDVWNTFWCSRTPLSSRPFKKPVSKVWMKISSLCVSSVFMTHVMCQPPARLLPILGQIWFKTRKIDLAPLWQKPCLWFANWSIPAV